MFGWIRCIGAIAFVGWFFYWVYKPRPTPQRYDPTCYNARGFVETIYKSKTVHNAGLGRIAATK